MRRPAQQNARAGRLAKIIILSLFFQKQEEDLVVGAAARARGRRLLRQDQRHDEPVEPQRLAKDEDQNHAYVEPGLLPDGAHARVAHDADGQARRERRQAAREARGEVRKARKGRVGVEAAGGRVDWEGRQRGARGKSGGGRDERAAGREVFKPRRAGGARGSGRGRDALLPTRMAATISP